MNRKHTKWLFRKNRMILMAGDLDDCVKEEQYAFDDIEVILVLEPAETEAVERLVKEYDDKMKKYVGSNDSILPNE